MITRQKQSGKAAKRLLCILLVACLAVTGCGGQTEQDTTVTTQETDLQEEETTEGTQAEPDETEPEEDGEPLWADPDTMNDVLPDVVETMNADLAEEND